MMYRLLEADWKKFIVNVLFGIGDIRFVKNLLFLV